MKVAVVGSRLLNVPDLQKYLPHQLTEIVSGGAAGVDRCAREYAQQNQIPLTEFLPQYDRYRRAAPIKRNEQLVAYADCVIAFWDGQSKGTLSSIQYALRAHKELHVYILQPNL